MKRYKKLLGIIFSLFIIGFSLLPQFRSIYALPQQIVLMQDDLSMFNVDYPFTVTVNDSITVENKNMFKNLLQPVFLDSIKLSNNITRVD